MRRVLIIFIFNYTLVSADAQVNLGMKLSYDVYQRFTNPIENRGLEYGSAGSALLNFGVGPKIWVGGSKVSLSVEAQFVIGLGGLAIKDYKGIGMISMPLMVHLNTNGLTGFGNEINGVSIGVGVQRSRTEIFGLRRSAKNNNVSRPIYNTVVAEIGYGYGNRVRMFYPYIRYGYNSDNKANIFHVGFAFDLTVLGLIPVIFKGL